MIRLLSLFSGIGAFEKALTKLGVEYELVNYCEIDKYASKSYATIHNVSESLNLHDVTNIDASKLSNIDLITYGFPCQDISLAGKQKGFFDENGSKTRSGLFFCALEVIKKTKPKYAIAENVKALTCKKFKDEFNSVLLGLDEAGYNNYWKVLNAKDYGIPQSRERVFIVSIRKDIDNGLFEFPQPMELKLRLKDILEPQVDEKFFHSKEHIKKFLEVFDSNKISNLPKIQKCGGYNNYNSDKILSPTGVSKTLVARDYISPTSIVVGNIYTNFKSRCAGLVYDVRGLSPTLNTCQGGGHQPSVIKNMTIRKLTPLEYYRLMGFDDEDFYKAKNAGISNSQLYKQAGNSIVVNVLIYIYISLQKIGFML